MIKAGDTVKWSSRLFVVHGVRSVTGGRVAMIERHPDEPEDQWPWTITRWEEPTCNLELLHSVQVGGRFNSASDNDTLDY